MATNIRIKVSGSYQDPDSLFEPRGGSAARANTGLKVVSQDFSDRYHQSSGGDTPSGSSTCYVKNGASYSDVLSLFRRYGYPIAPVIASVSVTSVAYVGDTISMSVTMSQGEDLSYQWYHDGAAISGATSSSYSFTATSTLDAGVYSVEVSNSRSTDSDGDNCTMFEDPFASISGSSSVAVGGGGGGSWSWSVEADAGIYRYRVYVGGHGGNWTYPGAGTYSASGSVSWGSPFGNPDFSNTPGSYTWYAEVEDVNGHTASDSHPFSVV
jgi:hypothetical protein